MAAGVMPAAILFVERSPMATNGTTDEQRGSMFQRFFHSQVSGSIVLMACTAAALIWANSPWSDRYFDLAATYIGVSWGDVVFKMSLSHWIMDGLMAIFVFVGYLALRRVLPARVDRPGRPWSQRPPSRSRIAPS